MNAWTESGKPIPFPSGQAHRPFCICCSHSEPGDLEQTFSYLEGRFVWSCRDEVWCAFRVTGNRRSRAAHPSSGGVA